MFFCMCYFVYFRSNTIWQLPKFDHIRHGLAVWGGVTIKDNLGFGSLNILPPETLINAKQN